MRAQNATGPIAHHAEGPVWWPGWGGLRYVDLSAGDLLTIRDDGVQRLATGSPVAAFVRPRASGGYVVAIERGIALSDHVDEAPDRAIELWGDSGVRANDGATDATGRLYVGSMAYDATPGAGALFRIDAELGRRRVLADVTISNGLAFSPDGARAYYADTATGRVDRFDLVDGELAHRRPFVVTEAVDGMPDGLTVAADGSVWVAYWGASVVRGFDVDGTQIASIELPATQVSACTFGGDDLDQLYITTSRQDLSDHEQPEAGSVFVAEVGVRGVPVVPFAG
ncbi:SMP-30/gluconolactonase/LRE family protein [Agromyces sp. PvR057]|uniref:SMP-30/gluconolactonase/LRE family protein n=1 Tax=Agromyces sp. PvR057 TaxID=3156403 RepID=UPI0033910631